MELKRASDKPLLVPLLRIRTELTLILVCVILAFFLPAQAVMGTIALFITKILSVNLGVLTAHASRKFMFPFLDFQRLLENKNWAGICFIIFWYGMIIWAFAIGG